MSNYRVFHWDTFEEPGEDTTLLVEVDSLREAEAYVERMYTGGNLFGQRIRSDGADRVDIVSPTGDVVRRYWVG